MSAPNAKSNAGLGFYKRRRGILEHLEAGIISLLDLAVHRMDGGGRYGPRPAVVGAGHEIA